MPDPLTTLGIAASVVQLIVFADSLLSKGRELQHSEDGVLVQQRELQATAETLQRLSSSLVLYRDPDEGEEITQTGHELIELCNGCRRVSEELVAALKKIKTVDATQNSFSSLYLAFCYVFNEAKIKEISERLEQYRRQIDTTLLICIR